MDESSRPTTDAVAPGLDARSGLWALQIVYAAAMSLLLAWRGLFPPPVEIFLLAGISLAAWRSRSEKAWVELLLPFALLALAYRGFQGFASGLTLEQINLFNLIAWEKALFGGAMPPAWLQARLFGAPWTPMLDAVCNLLYVSHFAAPVAAAAWIRSRKRRFFQRYMLGFFILAYLGFATYVLFPAAPPWWAAHYGYLSGEEAVSLTHFFIGPETMFRTPNPLAALPSMHCAYPLFIFLACWSLWGRRALPLTALPAGVGFAVVYLGHHYVVDVLAGYVYALAVWLAMRGRLRD